jgi:hypothetical protein
MVVDRMRLWLVAGAGFTAIRAVWRKCTPSARMLNLGIRFPLDHLLDLESSLSEIARHFVRAKKEEINAHFLTPLLIAVKNAIANVESQE